MDATERQVKVEPERHEPDGYSRDRKAGRDFQSWFRHCYPRLHHQYSNGIATVFGVAEQNSDTVHARVVSGKAVVYGSIVNATGDPSYVPGVRTRDDIVIQFLGDDLTEDGTVDLVDANGDGVLDTAIQVKTSLFPNYFRVMAAGEFGEVVGLEIVSSSGNTVMLDSDTFRMIATGDLAGKSGELVVRATSGTSSTLLRIPLLFF